MFHKTSSIFTVFDVVCFTGGAGESDLRIPQLDGIDDRAKAEKTAEPSLPKRKTRLTSVPESVVRKSLLSL